MTPASVGDGRREDEQMHDDPVDGGPGAMDEQPDDNDEVAEESVDELDADDGFDDEDDSDEEDELDAEDELDDDLDDELDEDVDDEDYEDDSDEDDDELDEDDVPGDGDDSEDDELEDAEEGIDEEADGDISADETDFSTVAIGANIEDAKRTALEQLRKIVPYVRESDVEFLVMEEGGRSGFLGMGGRRGAQVEARLRPSSGVADQPAEDAAVAQEVGTFLRTVIDLMGLEGAVNVTDDGESVVAELAGPDLGILIGRHGQTIDALQYVTMIAANRAHKTRRRVVVDAEGYRERREVSLHAIADRTAQKVARDRAPITLKPMTAAERKVIHLRLKDHPRVQTSSEGQEPNRAVVIEPR
jgi:spoIIIJ-associated protein